MNNFMPEENKTPWFLNTKTIKTLLLFVWITHIFSMVAFFNLMPTAVPIICLVLYVLLEKYVGYFIDIFAFIISIIYSCGLLIIVIGIGIVYPWLLKYAIYHSMMKYAKNVELEQDASEEV